MDYIPGSKKNMNAKTYITQDKIHAPLLFACSFSGLVRFVGSHVQNGVVYWEYAPYEKSKDLIEKYEVKVGPEVAIKDFVAAQKVF